MRKDALLAFLMNQTDFFDPENVSEVFTARYLAQRLICSAIPPAII